MPSYGYTLQWRHNGRDSVSNHQLRECLLSRLIRQRSKKTSKLRVTGVCAGKSPDNCEFPAQRTSNAKNISIWWRHHGIPIIRIRRTHDHLILITTILSYSCKNGICIETGPWVLCSSRLLFWKWDKWIMYVASTGPKRQIPESTTRGHILWDVFYRVIIMSHSKLAQRHEWFWYTYDWPK